VHRLATWILALATLAAAPASAADMYRWVDEHGRTNISDVVPERFRARAIKIDSKQFEPTARQREEALAGSAALRASAASSSSGPSASLPTASPTADRPRAIRSAASAPAPAANDCEALLRQYAQAQSCFAPCQQANGSVKAECFSRCPNVPDPSPRCGLPDLR
jgi:hypothetical protein